MLIEAEDDLVVAGEAADGQAAVNALARTPADVVLMDIQMPVLDGVEATQRLTAAGASSSEIGARLYLAEGKVKTHIGRLLAKLGVRDRVGLVLFAYETGIVSR